MLTRTIAHDPLARTIQPSCTRPLEDRPNEGLVSIWTMCIQPVSDSHAVWHTHQLPSLIIGHGTPHTTPEPLGPFMLRPAPIRACYPKPIDGWLTSLWSQPHCPCPCVCMWRIVHHCPCLILMSDPDTGLPPVRAIIRIGVPLAILDQV